MDSKKPKRLYNHPFHTLDLDLDLEQVDSLCSTNVQLVYSIIGVELLLFAYETFRGERQLEKKNERKREGKSYFGFMCSFDDGDLLLRKHYPHLHLHPSHVPPPIPTRGRSLP